MIDLHWQHIGKRHNQEDFLLIKEPIVVVCDGVGGSNKGEIASRFVAETFYNKSILEDSAPINEKAINDILLSVQQQMKARLSIYPEETGMGTTFSMAYKHNRGLTIAHIGDSRIYYIKPNKSLYWQTKDHSLVQQLLEGGHITEEGCLNHPLKNRITRAIQAGADTAFVKADVATISRIERGDLLFLCTDGVLEAFSNAELLELLTDSNLPVSSKYENISIKCQNSSKDNNTFVLIEFEFEDEVNAESSDSEVELARYNQSAPNSFMDSLLLWLLAFLTIVIAILILINYLK